MCKSYFKLNEYSEIIFCILYQYHKKEDVDYYDV